MGHEVLDSGTVSERDPISNLHESVDSAMAGHGLTERIKIRIEGEYGVTDKRGMRRDMRKPLR